jgi:hypothetical protein
VNSKGKTAVAAALATAKCANPGAAAYGVLHVIAV